MTDPNYAHHDPDADAQPLPGPSERDAILDALDRWIRQRPGLDPRNYISYGNDVEGRRAYAAEVRSITRDLHDARRLLAAVGRRSSIDADALRAAFTAYSGRLSLTTTATPQGWTATLDYCTGQYWPTEYRKAACAVLAYALWRQARADYGNEDRDGLSPGARMRRDFRREYGAAFQRRWLD